MDKSVFREISQIIERDSKDTTYKFALLRGVIEIVQDQSPFARKENGKVCFPVGLLIEKWLVYYYPIIDADQFIPQKNGEKDKKGVRLAFRPELKKITEFYKDKGGYSKFYNDLVYDDIDKLIKNDFILLVKKINNTIVKMPMKYLGRSVYKNNYSIFSYYPKNKKPEKLSDSIGFGYLIETFGTFSIAEKYFDAFEIIGSFLSGTDNLLFQWANFTVSASGGQLSNSQVLEFLLMDPNKGRNVGAAKNIYADLLKNNGSIECVWSGKNIRNFDVDHVIPFSAWRNNDLWNLLPSSKDVNNKKRNKIPSSSILKNRKGSILHYWKHVEQNLNQRFHKELTFSLIGGKKVSNWSEIAFSSLENHCEYLIHIRGMEPFEI